MAAKLKKINWEFVDKLAAIQCTAEEISEALGIDDKTLARAAKREKKINIGAYIARKRLGGLMSLRRRQYTTAMDGNPTMLVWLGKNWLGQTDKTEEENHPESVSLTVNLK